VKFLYKLLSLLFTHLDTEIYKQDTMNYLLRLIMVGLLIVACVWGLQPAALEDIETLSPSLLLTDKELNIQTEMLVEQPEIHVSKTARAILDQFPYLSASATEKVHKNAVNLVTTTYQSNDSLPKPNTGNESSHNSSAGTNSSTDDKKHIIMIYIMIFILAFATVIMIGILAIVFCRHCTCKCTDSKPESSVSARPPSKHYNRKVPSLLRSSRHNV
jgi:hypothetical protein